MDVPAADLDIESLDILEWLYVLEDEYGITLSDDDVGALKPDLSLHQMYEQLRVTASIKPVAPSK